MPTTLTGLVLFAALLVPGFTYVVVRRRLRPTRTPTAFEEVSEVAAVGILATTVAVAMAYAIAQLPRVTSPDVGSLIEHSGAYVAAHPALVFLWAAAALAAATVLAGIAAWQVNKREPHPSSQSAWWVLFDKWWRDREIYDRRVVCVLTDGSQVEGRLRTFSMAADDIADRDLIFDRVKYRSAVGGSALAEFAPGAVCISARNIVALFIKYQRRPGAATPRRLAASRPAEAEALRQASDHGPPSEERTDAESPAPGPA